VDDEAGRAAFGRVSALADEQGLSVYDAVYLETALRRGLPLGFRDRALVAAATRRGVKILD
jgi:predicted nucleic acid-binding protein